MFFFAFSKQNHNLVVQVKIINLESYEKLLFFSRCITNQF